MFAYKFNIDEQIRTEKFLLLYFASSILSETFIFKSTGSSVLLQFSGTRMQNFLYTLFQKFGTTFVSQMK